MAGFFFTKVPFKNIISPAYRSILRSRVNSFEADSSGYGRLTRPPELDGEDIAKSEYVLVEMTTLDRGGTLANLRGYIESNGGKVIVGVILTEQARTARFALDQTTLDELRGKHGEQFEQWWQELFGYPFDCLTQSEARYLANSPDAEIIRNRIAEAE